MTSETPHFSVISSGERVPMASEIDELTGLLRLIDDLPEKFQEDFYKLFQRLLDSFERRQRILEYVQETLNTMKLDLKYLIFDLEATRRERDEYKALANR